MKDALLANQVRGTDSTGLVVVGKEGMSVTHKLGINASAFLDTKQANDMVATIPRSRAAIGHVRAATMGAISAMNAHPFKKIREDGTYIVGVHNGTLVDWKLKKDSERYTVDSEWAFHMLATEGSDAFEYFKGAFAFVWYDSAKPDSLFMARNDERPLHYLITESGDTILGASELGMLAWIAERNKFKTHTLHPVPYYLEPGRIYEFSLNDIGDYESAAYPKHEPLTSKVGQATELRPNRQFMRDTGYLPVGYGGGHGQVDTQGWLNQRYGHLDTYGVAADIDDWYDWDYGGGSTMESVLTDVKTALREARYSPVKNPVTALDDQDAIISEADLELAILAAMELASEEEEAFPAASPNAKSKQGALLTAVQHGAIVLGSPLGKTVTLAESENARKLQLYGLVVKFSGTWHDPELMTCNGYYSVMENGVENTYDGEVRNISTTLANNLYLNRPEGEGELCAIVGVHSSVEWMMLEPLTWQQKVQLEEELLGKKDLASVH